MTDPFPFRPETRLFIDGTFVDAADRATLPTFAPATGRLVAEVAAGSAADIDAAVNAARRAFSEGAWSRDPQARKRALLRLAELVEADGAQLAMLDAVEAGKPIIDCEEGDVPDSVDTFRWFAELIDKTFDRVSPGADDHLGLIVREPIGVVGIITPWNFPLAMLAMKIAPALAAGNTVVVKPSELAALSSLRVAALSVEAGIPAGVLNVVTGHGADAGQALADHMDVDAVSFTGSTRTGRLLLQASAVGNLKRVTLELGGKSPQIVMASMRDELPRVAKDLVQAAFWNAGQNCTAGSRILVEESVREDLLVALAQAAAALVVGDPLDRRTTTGPLIHEAALRRALGAIDEARRAGARIVCGGTQTLAGTGGNYLTPTVVTDVEHSSRLCQEELFAPVTAVVGFSSEAEALALAGDTEYGLAANIWTRDIAQALRMSRSIQAGTVSVNGYSEGDVTTPFGGWRRSGFGGRDNGVEALEQYTGAKTVWVSIDG